MDATSFEKNVNTAAVAQAYLQAIGDMLEACQRWATMHEKPEYGYAPLQRLTRMIDWLADEPSFNGGKEQTVWTKVTINPCIAVAPLDRLSTGQL